ncbi:MAG: hypothetical protein IPL61_31320 [Myxococcales bacterium]|nr:hypothetical protein [Myxococcales bacterium]
MLLEAFVGSEFSHGFQVSLSTKDLESAANGKDGATAYSAKRFKLRARAVEGDRGDPVWPHGPMPSGDVEIEYRT